MKSTLNKMSFSALLFFTVSTTHALDVVEPEIILNANVNNVAQVNIGNGINSNTVNILNQTGSSTNGARIKTDVSYSRSPTSKPRANIDANINNIYQMNLGEGINTNTTNAFNQNN